MRGERDEGGYTVYGQPGLFGVVHEEDADGESLEVWSAVVLEMEEHGV